MKVTIDIPKEFVSHYKKDGFSESFDRILCDISDKYGLAGKYEREVLEMLKKAFEDNIKNEQELIAKAEKLRSNSEENRPWICKDYYYWRNKDNSSETICENFELW